MNERIKKLLAQLAAKMERATALNATLTERELTAEETGELDGLMAEMAALNAAIDTAKTAEGLNVRAIAPGVPALLSNKGGEYSLARAIQCSLGKERGGLEEEVALQLERDCPKKERSGFTVPALALHPRAQKQFAAIAKAHGSAVSADAWWQLSDIAQAYELQQQLGAAMMGESLMAKLGLTGYANNAMTIRVPIQESKLTATTFAQDAPAVLSPDATFSTIEMNPVTTGSMAIIKRSGLYATPGLGQSPDAFIAGQLGKAVLDEMERCFIAGQAGLILPISDVKNSLDSGVPPATALDSSYGQQLLSLVRAWQAYNQRPGDNGYRMLVPQDVMDAYMKVLVATGSTETFDSVFKLSASMVPTFTLPVTAGTPDTAPVYAGDFSSYVLWQSLAAEIAPNPYIQVPGQPGYDSGAVWIRVLQDWNLFNRDPGQVQSIPDVHIL